MTGGHICSGGIPREVSMLTPRTLASAPVSGVATQVPYTSGQYALPSSTTTVGARCDRVTKHPIPARAWSVVRIWRQDGQSTYFSRWYILVRNVPIGHICCTNYLALNIFSQCVGDNRTVGMLWSGRGGEVLQPWRQQVVRTGEPVTKDRHCWRQILGNGIRQ